MPHPLDFVKKVSDFVKSYKKEDKVFFLYIYLNTYLLDVTL